MRSFLTPRTSPHPLTPAPLRQSRIRECAAVVKGEFLPLFSFPSVFVFSYSVVPQQSSRISLHPDTKGSAQLPPNVKPLETARQPQAYLMNTLRRQRNYLPDHHQLRKLRPLLPYPNHELPSPLLAALSFLVHSDFSNLLPPILRLESLEARCKILTQEKQRLARAPASCMPIPDSLFFCPFSKSDCSAHSSDRARNKSS